MPQPRSPGARQVLDFQMGTHGTRVALLSRGFARTARKEGGTPMKALMPWTGMGALRAEMDRLFDRFWDVDLPAWPAAGEWMPKVDVADTKDAFVVKAEIPGIDPKEIGLTLEGDTLTIKGEKMREKEEKDEAYFRMERTYGAFARAIPLPAAVEAGKVTATFKNGLLTVTLPKGPEAKGKFIPIKAE
jgi:HSP20 family protein